MSAAETRNGVDYASTAGVPGVASNASFTGAWIPIQRVGSIGFQVKMAGTSNPQGTWGVDVTDDDDPNVTTPTMGATPLTLTAAMIAQNPAGAGVAIDYLFQFTPAPRAKWIRFTYTRIGGGSATATSLKIAVNAGVV